MSFKELIKSDLNTFFNIKEFGDEVIIDGKRQCVIIDDDRLQKKASEYGGLATGMVLYFIPVAALSKQPAIGDAQKFNGRLMFVEDVKEHMGMYEILLNQNRSG